MMSFYGLDELRGELNKIGYTIYADNLKAKENKCNWIACKPTHLKARNCECNDKPPQIVIKPYWYLFSDEDGYRSVEVGVTGEAGGQWYEFKAYAVSPDELMNDLESSLYKLECKLIKAWDSLEEA